MLTGKNIVMGVTGGIAAWKACLILNKLVIDLHANVDVIMTKNSETFITEQTIRTLSRNIVTRDMFKEPAIWSVEHISLARKADAFLIAPCTANVIGKIANGIADDMLTTTVMATRAPVVIAPAMNVHMYQNPAVQENLRKLKSRGWTVVQPGAGFQACGDIGDGRLPEPEELMEWLEMACGAEKDLAGKKVLVTAGATRESIDPVRFITNHSTGKMGVSLARAAAIRGASVTLVAADMRVEPPKFVETIRVKSAEDMFEAVTARSAEQDIIIMAAAVADFTPVTVADQKIKKKNKNEGMTLELTRTKDILAHLGSVKPEGQFLCGFAMETENLLANAAEKLTKKNADMIVANSLRTKGAGFGTDTNIVTIFRKNGERLDLPKMPKTDVARHILDLI